MEKMDSIVNESFFISIITKIETLGFTSGNTNVDNNTTAFINFATIFELTREIAQQTINFKKAHKFKTPDAIIAATALVHKLTLITRNIKDFKNINLLKTINPCEL